MSKQIHALCILITLKVQEPDNGANKTGDSRGLD
jgi:hypothetical protein